MIDMTKPNYYGLTILVSSLLNTGFVYLESVPLCLFINKYISVTFHDPSVEKNKSG